MSRPRYYAFVFSFSCIFSVFFVNNAGFAASPTFVQPVDAEVIDTFRAPAHQYGAGNRGWEYRAQRGLQVRAASAGTVSFLGRVNGNTIVVIQHAGNLRTTYLGLASVLIHQGEHVDVGQPIAEASGARLYFGARCGDTYIDPRGLFQHEVFLVTLDGNAQSNNNRVIAICDATTSAQSLRRQNIGVIPTSMMPTPVVAFPATHSTGTAPATTAPAKTVPTTIAPTTIAPTTIAPTTTAPIAPPPQNPINKNAARTQDPGPGGTAHTPQVVTGATGAIGAMGAIGATALTFAALRRRIE